MAYGDAVVIFEIIQSDMKTASFLPNRSLIRTIRASRFYPLPGLITQKSRNPLMNMN